MHEGNFRGIVREELSAWMDKNRGRFDLLMLRVLEQIAPIVAAELERGILVRVGKCDPDEREQVQLVIEQARAFVARYGLSKPDKEGQADRILQELDALASRLSQGPRPRTDGE